MDAVERIGRQSAGNLKKLSEILEGKSIPFAVVGATALLLHGTNLTRTTRDLDLVVAVSGGLTGIRPELEQSGLRSTGVEHCFQLQDGSEVDILAIDTDLKPKYRIQLEDGQRIDVVGLPEAIGRPSRIEIDGLVVPVAPLCLLIANKLRGACREDRPHDLQDACAAMQSYDSAGQRRFEVDYERYEELNYDTAGAFLAGVDTTATLSRTPRELIEGAIETLLDRPQLTDRYDRGEERRALVLAYRPGFHA